MNISIKDQINYLIKLGNEILRTAQVLEETQATLNQEVLINYDLKLSKYFTLRELLLIKNNTELLPLSEVSPEILNNLKKLCQKADEIREFYKKPIVVTSGFRPEWYNKQIDNAAPNSKHKFGQAMDFYISGVSPKQIQKDFNSKWVGGLGTYPTWNHVDTSENRRW